MQSPYVLLHNTESLTLLPPLWLLGFLWFGAYFGVGWIMGLIFSLEPLSCEQNVKRYKGGMLLVLALTLSFAWYLLLFGPGSFFLSWILLGLSIGLAVAATLCFMEFSKGWTVLLLAICVGSFLLFILQFMVMLHI